MVGRRLMVGRDRELGQMLAALERARRSADLVLLSGEAGIGKTTLASEVVALARDERRCVLEGRATHTDAPIPLGVFRDALRNHRRVVRDAPAPADELAAAFTGHLLPELGEPPRPELDDRDVLFESAVRYISELAAPSGLVMLLEDLHWADPTTHQLVLHLARVSTGVPLLIIATCRSDGAGVDASLDRFRLDRRREQLGEEIPLIPLDGDASALLAQRVCPDLDDAAIADIRRLGDGNPFVIEELARDARAGAAIGDGEVPWTVRQMLMGRMDRIATDDRELLGWAAVEGECFDLTLLQEVSGYDDDAFLTSLDNLRKAALIEDDQCTLERMCFRHTLTREVVLQELIPPDRRRRYRRLLEAASGLPDPARAKSLESLVDYAVGAGDRPAAFGYSVAAARRSLSLGGYVESDAHYERALELWTPEIGDRARAQALFELGRSLAPSRHAATALELLDEARVIFTALGDRVGAAVALAVCAAVRRELGRGEDVVADLRAAADELGEDAPILARLQVAAELARVLMIMGRGGEASEVASGALELVSEAPARDEALEAVQLWISLGAGLGQEGKDGGPPLRRALDLARAIGDPVGTVRALGNLEVLLRWQQARYDEAAALREEGIAIARRYGLRMAESWLWDAEAEARTETGDLTGAREALAECERLVGRGSDHLEDVAVGLARRANLQLAVGEFDEAEEMLARAWPQLRAGGHIEIGAINAVCLALARFGKGDADASARTLEDDVLPMVDAGRSDHRWPALVIALGLAGAMGRPDLADRLPPTTIAWAGPQGVALVDALRTLPRDEDPPDGAIEDGAAALDEAGFRWYASVVRLLAASALARFAPGDRAAELARGADRWFTAITARGWSQVGRGVLRQLGRRAPSAPARGQGDLTARELEVLRLVADGATNREIAERLVISPPTAARHVANIFLKLGVGSRAEAVRVASERQMLGHAAST